MKKTLSMNLVNKGSLTSIRGYDINGETFTITVHRDIKVASYIVEKIAAAFVLDGVENEIRISDRFENGCYQISSVDFSYLGCMSGRNFVITDEYEL